MPTTESHIPLKPKHKGEFLTPFRTRENSISNFEGHGLGTHLMTTINNNNNIKNNNDNYNNKITILITTTTIITIVNTTAHMLLLLFICRSFVVRCYLFVVHHWLYIVYLVIINIYLPKHGTLWNVLQKCENLRNSFVLGMCGTVVRLHYVVR